MNLLRLVAVILFGMALTRPLPAAPPEGEVSSASSKEVTAAQVNGTWEFKSNTLKIWALGKGKLKVAFDGIFEYKSPQGPMANTGVGSGIATINGDTAIFRPEGAEEECKITMKFTGGKLIVTQVGTCGFGNRVVADGTYNKTSSKKPKFEE